MSLRFHMDDSNSFGLTHSCWCYNIMNHLCLMKSGKCLVWCFCIYLNKSQAVQRSIKYVPSAHVVLIKWLEGLKIPPFLLPFSIHVISILLQFKWWTIVCGRYLKCLLLISHRDISEIEAEKKALEEVCFHSFYFSVIYMISGSFVNLWISYFIFGYRLSRMLENVIGGHFYVL